MKIISERKNTKVLMYQVQKHSKYLQLISNNQREKKKGTHKKFRHLFNSPSFKYTGHNQHTRKWEKNDFKLTVFQLK